MFNYQSVTQSEAGTSDWVLLDPTETGWSVSVHAEHSGTSTYSIEVSGEPTGTVTASSDAFATANATDQTANVMIALTAPVSAVRVNITSYTSGSVVLHVRQAGKPTNPANPQS